MELFIRNTPSVVNIANIGGRKLLGARQPVCSSLPWTNSWLASPHHACGALQPPDRITTP